MPPLVGADGAFVRVGAGLDERGRVARGVGVRVFETFRGFRDEVGLPVGLGDGSAASGRPGADAAADAEEPLAAGAAPGSPSNAPLAMP
ncbi:hypothetical protein, partial [Actinomadura bangladeshensis]|uniref:hypothetical protein n=1 Tax=Actinomadura bangladeshensis TaxID=453573 RepID=UPI001EF3A42C